MADERGPTPDTDPGAGADVVVEVLDADRDRVVVVSFDIDGTVEDGDPPGPLAVALIHQARELGYVIGSASDRTISDQKRIWALRGIDPDFVSLKHHLHEVAASFPDHRLIHIGDTDVDAYYANLAGFDFVHVAEVPVGGTPGWIF